MNKVKIDVYKLIKNISTYDENFASEITNEILTLLTIFKKSRNKILKKALANYIVIREVGFVETECRNITKLVIDNFGFDIKGVFSNDELIISILQLDEIKKNSHLTKGEIVAQNNNFQNLKEIDSVFSKILRNKSLFERISTLHNNDQEINVVGVGKLKFSLKDLYLLFKTRHEIVHRLYTNTKLSYPVLFSWCFQCTIFLISLRHIFIVEHITREDPNGKDPKYIELLQKARHVASGLTFRNQIS